MTVVQLGAPGVYPAPPSSAPPGVEPVRLDAAGFVGIAPRGPVNCPILIQSWAEYVRRFGGLDAACPGRLADAVATFFRQGGARARVVRVAPRSMPAADDPLFPVAVHELSGFAGPVRLAARDEGSWGGSLRVRLELVAGVIFTAAGGDESLTPPAGAPVPAGSLLRITVGPAVEFRWVLSVELKAVGDRRRPVLHLDRALPDGAAVVEVLAATVSITSSDPQGPPDERFDNLGLSPAHPRWLAAVITDQSLVVRPYGAWDAPVVPTTTTTIVYDSTATLPGRDRYREITGGSFFDVEAPGYPPPEVDPDSTMTHVGVDALEPVAADLGLLVVPDLLYAPDPLAPAPQDKPAPRLFRPVFTPSPPPELPAGAPAAPVPPWPSILGDPGEIRSRQLGLVARSGSGPAIVLLDVPPGLRGQQVLDWRSAFDSDRVAAYHPWLRLVRPDGTLVMAPPSAFAAGIVAARELRSGIAHGPANDLALDAVGVADAVTEAEHAVLHRAGVNAFRAEPAGVRLLGARTLSSDPAYRQISVRRVMTWVLLSIVRLLETAVFENNTTTLRTTLRLQVTSLLTGLFRAGALAGASEAEAFFVTCDDALNPPQTVDQGRLVIEVGLHPAEPVEFILLRLSLAGNGSVTVQGDGR